MAVAKPKTRFAKCCHYCRIVTTFLFSHVGLCALVLAYAFGGAFTFQYLEHGFEETIRNNSRDKRSELVDALWTLTDNQTVLVRDAWIAEARLKLDDFEEYILNAVKKDGYDDSQGYGNIAPKTWVGQLVTMLYAIFGIPLMLLCLSNIGDVMAHSFKFLYWKVCYTLCIKKKKSKRHRRHKRHQRQIITQQPMSSEFPEMIPMTPLTPYPGLPGHPYGPAVASYTLPSRGRAFHQQSSQRFTDHHEANRVPIISNKYALQSDVHDEPLNPANRFTFPGSHLPFSGASTLPNRMPRPPPLVSPFPPVHAYEAESYSESEDSDDDSEDGVPIFMIVGLVVGYIYLGAWLFRQWETSWSTMDSVYFCFVTLTTIGFGDMVPGSAVISGDGNQTLIICALYLLFGMALLAMSFNLVKEEVVKSVRYIGKKIGIISAQNKAN
ncbi:hypothetical protein HDE_07399 [Halotydeus destructor]|nr:hypothetical protein HDE_07399 [Halotydeus destructor]